MTSTDARVIGDVLLATLLAPVVRMIAMKAFIEPAAAWAGRRGWRIIDQALNDRLPDL